MSFDKQKEEREENDDIDIIYGNSFEYQETIVRIIIGDEFESVVDKIDVEDMVELDLSDDEETANGLMDFIRPSDLYMNSDSEESDNEYRKESESDEFSSHSNDLGYNFNHEFSLTNEYDHSNDDDEEEEEEEEDDFEIYEEDNMDKKHFESFNIDLSTIKIEKENRKQIEYDEEIFNEIQSESENESESVWESKDFALKSEYKINDEEYLDTESITNKILSRDNSFVEKSKNLLYEERKFLFKNIGLEFCEEFAESIKYIDSFEQSMNRLSEIDFKVQKTNEICLMNSKLINRTQHMFSKNSSRLFFINDPHEIFERILKSKYSSDRVRVLSLYSKDFKQKFINYVEKGKLIVLRDVNFKLHENNLVTSVMEGIENRLISIKCNSIQQKHISLSENTELFLCFYESVFNHPNFYKCFYGHRKWIDLDLGNEELYRLYFILLLEKLSPYYLDLLVKIHEINMYLRKKVLLTEKKFVKVFDGVKEISIDKFKRVNSTVDDLFRERRHLFTLLKDTHVINQYVAKLVSSSKNLAYCTSTIVSACSQYAYSTGSFQVMIPNQTIIAFILKYLSEHHENIQNIQNLKPSNDEYGKFLKAILPVVLSGISSFGAKHLIIGILLTIKLKIIDHEFIDAILEMLDNKTRSVDEILQMFPMKTLRFFKKKLLEKNDLFNEIIKMAEPEKKVEYFNCDHPYMFLLLCSWRTKRIPQILNEFVRNMLNVDEVLVTKNSFSPENIENVFNYHNFFMNEFDENQIILLPKDLISEDVLDSDSNIQRLFSKFNIQKVDKNIQNIQNIQSNVIIMFADLNEEFVIKCRNELDGKFCVFAVSSSSNINTFGNYILKRSVNLPISNYKLTGWAFTIPYALQSRTLTYFHLINSFDQNLGIQRFIGLAILFGCIQLLNVGFNTQTFSIGLIKLLLMYTVESITNNIEDDEYISELEDFIDSIIPSVSLKPLYSRYIQKCFKPSNGYYFETEILKIPDETIKLRHLKDWIFENSENLNKFFKSLYDSLLAKTNSFLYDQTFYSILSFVNNKRDLDFKDATIVSTLQTMNDNIQSISLHITSSLEYQFDDFISTIIVSFIKEELKNYQNIQKYLNTLFKTGMNMFNSIDQLNDFVKNGDVLTPALINLFRTFTVDLYENEAETTLFTTLGFNLKLSDLLSQFEDQLYRWEEFFNELLDGTKDPMATSNPKNFIKKFRNIRWNFSTIIERFHLLKTLRILGRSLFDMLDDETYSDEDFILVASTSINASMDLKDFEALNIDVSPTLAVFEKCELGGFSEVLETIEKVSYLKTCVNGNIPLKDLIIRCIQVKDLEKLDHYIYCNLKEQLLYDDKNNNPIILLNYDVFDKDQLDDTLPCLLDSFNF
eukprot:TRINITY_DN2933_c1_g2_i1.p1 TRINITY_DN2933_c1_g2~~TRINITY_DN2933_c1_g2_i1.p1  ORF type:complete len:1457 (+),score=458.68 TRINITY_DN2933_c1_g2_i1:282-4373(+)